MGEKYEPEDLILGAGHLDKVGLAVIVDVDRHGGRTLYTGVFHGARDRYGVGDSLEFTTLYVGQQKVDLDWEGDDTLTAQISLT